MRNNTITIQCSTLARLKDRRMSYKTKKSAATEIARFYKINTNGQTLNLARVDLVDIYELVDGL